MIFSLMHFPELMDVFMFLDHKKLPTHKFDSKVNNLLTVFERYLTLKIENHNMLTKQLIFIWYSTYLLFSNADHSFDNL